MKFETGEPFAYRFYMTGSVKDFCEVRSRYRGQTLWYQFKDIDVISVADDAFLIFTVNFETHTDCISFYLSHQTLLKIDRVESASVPIEKTDHLASLLLR